MKDSVNRLRRPLRTILCVLLPLIVVISAVNIAAVQVRYAAARREYDRLAVHGPTAGEKPPASAAAAPALAEINPDYIGWITIADTPIDYPVVRGGDNSRYLSTTFSGAYNPAGAIFMDTRCTAGFDGRFSILYGHNMKDGTMFASLHRYLDDAYRAAHPVLTITFPGGARRIYRVLAAILTHVYDPAYSLPEGGASAADAYLAELAVPADTRVLALSTCTNSGVKTDRLLVFAAAE